MARLLAGNYRSCATTPRAGYRRLLVANGKVRERAANENYKIAAVLPFKFVGATEEGAYLGIGLTDTLITKLVFSQDSING